MTPEQAYHAPKLVYSNAGGFGHLIRSLLSRSPAVYYSFFRQVVHKPRMRSLGSPRGIGSQGYRYEHLAIKKGS
jgi:hypothetical protein